MTKTTTKDRILPLWVMRLIGISSLATAVIGFAIYWFKKYPPRRKINDSSSEPKSNEVRNRNVGFLCNCNDSSDINVIDI
jgi:hypothetical protein